MSDKTKHIIIAVTNDLHYDQRMQRIAHSLSDGHKVTLVGRTKYKGQQPPHLPHIHTHLLTCRFSGGKLFYIEYQCRLLVYLLFSKFDAIYCVDLDTLWGGFPMAYIRNKKRIFDAHEYFTEVPEVMDRPLTRLAWRITARIWIPRAHLCFTVNQVLSDLFHKQYKVPFVAIHNMPNFKIWHHKAAKTEKVLLYQGVLNVGRGLEAIIETMPRLPEYQLWLAGEGDLSTNLRELVRELGLNHQVHFLGYLKPSDLDEITAQSYIGLNLLQSTSLNYYYSLANKFFDYVQAGIPQISMSFPVYRQFNDKYEVAALVQELHQDTIYAAIKALEDNSLRQHLIQNCRVASKVWVWTQESDRLLYHIQTLWK